MYKIFQLLYSRIVDYTSTHESNWLLMNLIKLAEIVIGVRRIVFAVSLRDDLRVYLPEILPRFTSLFQEAEREGSYQMVQPALDALEAIGPTLEDHLQLLLPALVRLVPPGKALFRVKLRMDAQCICHQKRNRS